MRRLEQRQGETAPAKEDTCNVSRSDGVASRGRGWRAGEGDRMQTPVQPVHSQVRRYAGAGAGGWALDLSAQPEPSCMRARPPWPSRASRASRPQARRDSRTLSLSMRARRITGSVGGEWRDHPLTTGRRMLLRTWLPAAGTHPQRSGRLPRCPARARGAPALAFARYRRQCLHAQCNATV